MMRDAHLQIATEGDARGVLSRTPGAAEIFEQVQPPRLHAAAVVRVSDCEGASAQELSPDRSTVARLTAVVSPDQDEQDSGSQHAVPRVSRVELGPASSQVDGSGGAVVRDRQTTGIDGGNRLQSL